MKAEYLSFFMNPSCPEASLTFVGTRNGKKLVRGSVFARDRHSASVDSGVLSFPRSVTNWSSNDLQKLLEAGGIPRCWKRGIQNGTRSRHRRTFCEALASTSGVILEIGTGPGGGNLVPVLNLNPEARVIINDLSPQLLELWRRFLATERPNSNLCFAAFDARKQVIRSSSLSAVSSCGGIGGILHTCGQSNALRVAHKAILAAARTLLPGGVFFLNEFVIDPDDWSRLPLRFRREWQRHCAWALEYAELMKRAGLEIEFREKVPGRALRFSDHKIVEEAAAYGVRLRLCYEFVRARKPRDS